MPTRQTLLCTARAAFGAGLVAAVILPNAAHAQIENGSIDFSRDIRPILSDTCFKCHGPDAEQRQADLRLDTRDGLFRNLDGVKVISPGNLKQSELVKRIDSTDPDEQMPPPDSGRALTAKQRDMIRKWVQQGAEWKQHWAFVVPKRPALPTKLSRDKWPRNPIDSFVLARLDREGLHPSPDADRRTLIRRVTLDLTGLPPTPEEVAAFLTDKSQTQEAFEKVVDRLLKSPRHAERMAVRWLDAARYADTSGYQSDGPRYMWRWRDWVLEAFLNNKPFDEFTIEQLAGDMLPDPTLDQRIATAFNRNHRGNAEGGIVPEEFQVEYVVDRVDTTFTIWQGLTMGCARCHSHKYDPISQKEYYQVFACFNNIPENGRALKEGNSPPWIFAPTREQDVQWSQLARLKAERELDFEDLQKAVGRKAFRTWAQSGWKDAADDRKLDDWPNTSGRLLNLPLDRAGEAAAIPQASTSDEKGASVTKFEGNVEIVAGRRGKAVNLDGNGFVDAGNVADFGYFDSFSIAATIRVPEIQPGTIVSRMELVDRGAGYNLHLTEHGTVQVNFVKRWLDDSLRIETVEKIPVDRWVRILMTYDGTRTAGSIRVYFDGRLVETKANLDGINQTFASDEPFRVGAGNSNFHGLIDEVRVFDHALLDTPAAPDTASEGVPDSIRELLSAGKKLDEARQRKLRLYFWSIAGPQGLRKAWSEVRDAAWRLPRLVKSLPTVMVMEELPEPRATHILLRGQYDRPGERVHMGVPSTLPPLPDDAPKNRLGFARWLVSGENPLTARVTVNRFWRDLFGTGLVKTTEDFGSQGERPSHPDLLDWLAVEFVESGWDVRHILKTIVMSRTYQQSSKMPPLMLARDPENRLLGRGARFRLPAETIRDQALFVSGLLTEKLGGPSVKPYQPAGLWSEIASDTEYDTATGADLYRRSLYTYWKRTVAPPMMANFDASAREMCDVRLTKTNTPLQALNLLNDVTFVEASRKMAERVIMAADSPQARLSLAFVLTTSREPSPAEQDILLRSQSVYENYFKTSPDKAESYLDYGESKRPATLNVPELAAWTAICSTLLNLDETVTKE
jgi:hypothetical protein